MQRLAYFIDQPGQKPSQQNILSTACPYALDKQCTAIIACMLPGFAISLVVALLLCQAASKAIHDTKPLFAAVVDLLQQLPGRGSMHLARSRAIAVASLAGKTNIDRQAIWTIVCCLQGWD